MTEREIGWVDEGGIKRESAARGGRALYGGV